MKKSFHYIVFLINCLLVAYLIYAFLFIHFESLSNGLPWEAFLLDVLMPVALLIGLVVLWRAGKSNKISMRLFWILGVAFPIIMVFGFQLALF
jgi:carbon starvation protein CstA